MPMCSMTAMSSIQARRANSPPTKRACNRSPARVLRNGLRRRKPIARSSARLSRIETVFRAHLADEREVLAAGDKTHHRTGDMAARHIGLDDIGLLAAIGGKRTLRVHR